MSLVRTDMEEQSCTEFQLTEETVVERYVVRTMYRVRIIQDAPRRHILSVYVEVGRGPLIDCMPREWDTLLPIDLEEVARMAVEIYRVRTRPPEPVDDSSPPNRFERMETLAV